MTETPCPAGPRAAPAELAAQVFREQLRMVFNLVPAALFSRAVLVGVVVLQPVVPAGVLAVWAVLMFVLTGQRAVAVWRYARRPLDTQDYAADRRYTMAYFVPFVASGLGWGLLPVPRRERRQILRRNHRQTP